MLAGEVDFLRRPVLRLRLSGPYGAETVAAVVDTGFNGFLSVPEPVVLRLGLRFHGPVPYRDASGQGTSARGYVVDVDWIGGTVRCAAPASRLPHCLIGTELLNGYVLEIDFGAAKKVEIR